jgi:folylpolyglutamate synthase
MPGRTVKGSTCAFVASFLAAYRERCGFPRKIGLYTSPYLTCVREAIRLNGSELSEKELAKYFFEIWHRLSNHQSGDRMPRRLQFLALLAIHVFIQEEVDVAIIETHHGGENDATNVIPQPVVTGITAISKDHVELLGNDIRRIAWHKGGIFKNGTPGFSVPQIDEVALVLANRAEQKGVNLQFVNIDTAFKLPSPVFQVEEQRVNATLALALTNSFLDARKRSFLTPSDVSHGLNLFQWPGRFQRIHIGRYQWFVDGAHNAAGIQVAARWFSQCIIDSQRYCTLFLSSFPPPPVHQTFFCR